MDYHHVVEAAGIVIVGLVFYSYTWKWFAPSGRVDRRWRGVVNGLAFGVLAIVLMVSRIQVGEGVFIDARAVPIALLGLVEGGPAALIAALVAVGYRVWLGGSGAVGGVLGILGTAAVGWLAHRWTRRDGRVRAYHAFALGVAVFVVTFGSFLVLGRRGLTLIAPVWLPFLVMSVLGVGLLGRLFADVAESRAAEAARREAVELRAVTLLARAAAHEINNPLNIVLGGLTLVGRRLPPEGEDAHWIRQATAGAQQIKEIVARLNQVTEIRTAPEHGALPPMLDIRRSAGAS